SDLESFAVRELQANEPLDLISDDPGEIRRWTKAKAGIDLEFPTRLPATTIRLLGVRLTQHEGTPVAAIAYRAGAGGAALLVSRTAVANEAEHRLTRSASSHGTSLFSWRMHGQIYVIACSMGGNPHAACLLCHAEERRGIAVN